jgi:hypothetical protein
MPQTPSKSYALLKGLAVLTTEKGMPQLILDVMQTGDTLTITDTNGEATEFPTSNITVDDRTARIEFVSGDTTYRIRELRETDGSWLSIMRVDLPTEALRAFSSGGNMNPDETVDAYALEDSAYIVGLVYSNAVGRWSRVDGDWILLAPGDKTYDGMSVFTIDPDRAQAYISLFDKNHVTITDTEQYESANQSEAPVPDPENPTE